ncbi:MAG: hypothetical protein M3Y08_08560 [Fibrobacterota bacterium]|nr:hypothetical protein [Fibrobacterota bacterium]
MRNPLILAWWLFMLASLQVAALILDRAHHLEWGQVGVLLIKACYLGFAGVLFIRYLSFRSQKSFENLLESYNLVAKTAIAPEKIRKNSWVNPFLNLVLVVLASINFTLVFNWNEGVFKTSVLLDLVIWLLTLRWLVRVFWLKSKGTRERLKEALDDSRSRMKAPDGVGQEVTEKRISRIPFAVLGLLSIAAALGISWQRWSDVRDVFRVNDLKVCMDRTMRSASGNFYQQGRLEIDMEAFPCIRERNGMVDVSLNLYHGELLMRAVESQGVDYFENGTMGDEGLVLDATGRFRSAWSAKFEAEK